MTNTSLINIPERILIVGFGSMGKRHLRLARELLPNADIRILRLSGDLQIPELASGLFGSVEDALKFSPHLAVISNPAPFHLEISLLLAEHGVHLLVEKPLAASIVGVPKLLQTCLEHNVVLLVGYNLRYLRSLSHYRYLLNSEQLVGKILSVRCEVGQHLSTWRPGRDFRETVSAKQDLGGGVLLELSHELDYMRWIFGEVSWVQATLCQQHFLDINVEDTAHLVLGFESGVASSKLIGVVNLDFIRHDPTRTCMTIGEKGSLIWNGLTGEITFFDPQKGEWQIVFSAPDDKDESYRAEWKNFISSISGGGLPLVDGGDGLKVLHIINAARRSAVLGGEKVFLEGSANNLAGSS